MAIRLSGQGGAGRAPGEFPACGDTHPAWFPWLLVDLHRRGVTGSLKVTGPGYAKQLFFREGRILFGSSNDPRHQLGAILIESGRITCDQLNEANARVGPGNPLAKVLAESGFVDVPEIGDAARVKVERILADVLSCESGSFEFEEGVLPMGAVDLRFSTVRLLLAAVRRIPDCAFALRHVQMATVLEPAPEGEAALSEVRAEVRPLLEQLDGHRTLEDAIAFTRLDEFEAIRTACAMLFLGVVRRKGAAPSPPGGDRGALDRVTSERTAWQYVTAMHAAAVGGPRAPIRGIVEDVEDMRKQLTRERDEARARVAELEKRLGRRRAWSHPWSASFLRAAMERIRSRLAGAGGDASAGPAETSGIEPIGTLSAGDRAFIDEHLGEGRVYAKYGLLDRARAQFEAILARFPNHPETLQELNGLHGEKRDDESAIRHILAMAGTPAEAKATGGARDTHPGIGELLLKEGLVSPQQLQEALDYQKTNGGKLSRAFISLGFVKDEEITALLSVTHNVPSIDLSRFEVEDAMIKVIPAETARKYQVLPLVLEGVLTVAMRDPSNALALDEVKSITGYRPEPVVASESALEEAIERYYGPAGSPSTTARSLDLRGLQLVWSREDPPPGDSDRGPAGGDPAA